MACGELETVGFRTRKLMFQNKDFVIRDEFWNFVVGAFSFTINNAADSVVWLFNLYVCGNAFCVKNKCNNQDFKRVFESFSLENKIIICVAI